MLREIDFNNDTDHQGFVPAQVRRHHMVRFNDFLNGLFSFVPAVIGQPATFHESEIKFFYSLHTIPTVGFEVFFGDTSKSMIYSGDTSFNRNLVKDLETRMVIGKTRAANLLNFPFKNTHDLVFHDMGFPLFIRIRTT